MSAESQQLLAEYVASGSERAFQELVSRYVDLVHSTALRLVEGDSHRAQDVAQAVFVDLARMAPRLSTHSLLGGWLHRHTCFVARTVMRGERRRLARERQAVEMSALDNQAEAALAEMAAVLDEAIHELGPDDRDAILLRFYERRSLCSVGEALGINENVAQKRVARAVEALAGRLRQRGVALSAGALAGGLSAGAVKAAPAGLALVLSKGALAQAGVAGGSAAKLALLAKLKVALVSVVVVAGLATIVWLQFPLPAQPQARPAVPALRVAEAQPDDPALVSPANAPSSPTPPQSTPSSASKAQGLLSLGEQRAAVAPSTTTVAGSPEDTLAPGALPQRLTSRAGSSVLLQGTTSLGKWQAKSEMIAGFLELESSSLPQLAPGAKPIAVPARGEVQVPVASLKSIDAFGKPFSDAMDNVMHRELLGRDENAKRVRFQLTELTLEPPTPTNGSALYFRAKGTLAVAGVSKAVNFRVSAAQSANGHWKISGMLTSMMSSFGIQSAFLSDSSRSLQVADLVLITFDWIVGPSNTSPAVASKTAAGPQTDPGIADNDLVPLALELPAAAYSLKAAAGRFRESTIMEPVSSTPRPLLLVPYGLTNLACAARLTSSDRTVRRDDLARIVDGDKEADSAVFLHKGVQWVQLDLGRRCEVYAIVVWHAHDAPKFYHDVAVQIAEDPECRRGARTLFNNDRTNALGLGVGSDREYLETFEGKLLNAKGAAGRYLRFYSKGSTQSALNEYTEIEVYGRPVAEPESGATARY